MKGIWEEILGQEAKTKDKPNISESEIGIDQILNMRLSKLSRRIIAIKIYSDVLGCEIWLCGNEQIAAQLRQDDPQTVVYTADELRKLNKLQPSPEDLRAIHNTKDVFEESRIVDSSLKGNGDESDKT